MNELISIIIPAYNVQKYISKCIESVISQTYKKLEIIIIDDGSKDNTLKICEEFMKKDDRIKVIHIENAGVSNARNIGLNNSNGKYISFIDADDFVNEFFCEKMLKALIENNCDVCSCGYNRVYNSKTEIIVNKNINKITGIQFLNKIFEVQSSMGFCHMKLWKKEVLNNIKFNTNIIVAEDALFCMEVSKNIKEVYILNEPLYNYRCNENSLVKKFDLNYVKKYLDAMKVTKEYLKNIGLDESKKFANYISYHILLIVVNYCFNPENPKNSKDRRKELRQICNISEFKNAIQRSEYKGFSISRKVTLFTLKYHLYRVTEMIGKYRQKQIRK